jgi:hypothetical protein
MYLYQATALLVGRSRAGETASCDCTDTGDDGKSDGDDSDSQ